MDHIIAFYFYVVLCISIMVITIFDPFLAIGPSFREIQASKSPKNAENTQKMSANVDQILILKFLLLFE